MTFLFYLLLDLFDPVSGAAYCSSPAFYHGISLLVIDLRAENTFHITAFQYCLLAFPESHSKTCKICGTKSSCLNTFRTFYSYITDIGLDLQEKIFALAPPSTRRTARSLPASSFITSSTSLT